MKMVQIIWNDANEMHGWGVEEEIKLDKLPVVETIGYLFSQDDEQLVIVSSQSDYGAYLGRLAIPKGCVKTIKELRVK